MGGFLATLQHVNGYTRERRAAALNAGLDSAQWLGPRGSTATFKNVQGFEIAGYFWPVEQPKGIILIVHSQGTYLLYDYGCGTGAGAPKVYDGSWVAAMNGAGYSVAGIDNQGHGRSGGLFGYVNRFGDFAADLLQFAALMRSPKAPQGFGPQLPLFALGSSMGGCIALCASMRQPLLFRGLILLAPMLSLERAKRAGANWLLALLSFLLNKAVPTWPLVATPENWDFPELQADWDLNPVAYHYPKRVRSCCEFLRICDWLAPCMASVTTPLLVFHSENDTTTDPAGSKALIARSKAKDKSLRLVNDFWHMLSVEHGNEGILSEALTWMNARVCAPR